MDVPIPSCAQAIQAALAALPPDHPLITSVSFSYGPYCPPGRYCVLPLPPAGHVIVDYADGAQVLVAILGKKSGRVVITKVGPLPT